MWEVIHAFGWAPTSIKPGAGVWEVTDGDERYALKESNVSREKLLVLHHMLEQVREAGFPQLLPWVEALDGEVVVSAYGSQWYATPWQTSKDEETLDVSELATSLGKFHRLAEPIAAQFPKLHRMVGQEESSLWKQRQAQVSEWQDSSNQAQISAIASNHQPVSGFNFAIKGLERYFATEKGVAPRYTLCHERIHPSNILSSEEDFYWIDFDHAELNTPIKDLATFIHRFPDVPAKDILEAYEQENKLLPKEKRLLAIFLAYPERLVRIVERETDNVDFAQEFVHVEECQALAKSLWPSKKKSKTLKAQVHSQQQKRKK